jgi:hypothetical protein
VRAIALARIAGATESLKIAFPKLSQVEGHSSARIYPVMTIALGNDTVQLEQL